MPYILERYRKELNPRTDRDMRTAGELNFCLTSLALQYAEKSLVPGYQKWNDIIGAFDAAAKEIYRRRIAPYEDKKILENGDVFPKEG